MATEFSIGVAGDDYLISFLCPDGERRDEWLRRSYDGGAAALEDFCHGLLEGLKREADRTEQVAKEAEAKSEEAQEIFAKAAAAAASAAAAEAATLAGPKETKAAKVAAEAVANKAQKVAVAAKTTAVVAADTACKAAEVAQEAENLRIEVSIRNPADRRERHLLLHRACKVKDDKDSSVSRWFIDISPPVGPMEYAARDIPFDRNLPGSSARKPGLLLIRDSGVEKDQSSFYDELPDDCHVVRFSAPLVPALWRPRDLPAAKKWRSWTEIINIDQIARELPIARNSSYEAITRDLLRFFATDKPGRIFMPFKDKGVYCPPACPVTFVIRIHSSAMLVLKYPMAGDPEKSNANGAANTAPNVPTPQQQAEEEKCSLIFHPETPAPVMGGTKNKIAGTGGMLAAQVAISLGRFCRINGQGSADEIFSEVEKAVMEGINLRQAASDTGLVFLGADSSNTRPLFEFMIGCVAERFRERAKPLNPIRLNFEKDSPGKKRQRKASVVETTPEENPTNDFQEIRSVHTEWLIQNLRTRQWRRSLEEENEKRASGKKEKILDSDKIHNSFHPACIVAAKKAIREEAMEYVHKLDIIKSRLVDRNEVEDYLALQSVLRSYATTLDAPRPLNLGVFGAPGSGKSFGVKQLVEHCGKSGLSFSDKILEFNMSQFASTSDLADSLHQVRDKCMSGKIPVAFFDEFDSTFKDEDFGWLKYLLMPMQDSVFVDNNKQYRLGRCVLIFAGGINRSFHELNGRVRDQKFVVAKGPDFISRLRGYLNIRSINFPENATDKEKQRCQLRRAVLLENMLFRKHGEKSISAPLLDLPLAHAILNIEGFRHGVRSLEAILDMSEFLKKETLRASSLPTWAQMEMHVDSRSWVKLMNDGEKKLEWLKGAATSME